MIHHRFLAWTFLSAGALLLASCGTEDTDPHLSEEDPSLFWTIVENEKDWWEELKIGRVIDGKVAWLTLNDSSLENAIQSVEFVQLKGSSSSFLEVYGMDHMGNGNLHLFKIDGNTVKEVLNTWALDIHQDASYLAEDPSTECSGLLKDGALTSTYEDLNADGFDDLVLHGTQLTFCSPSGGSLADVMSSSPDKTSPIEESFIWDAATESFVEQAL